MYKYYAVCPATQKAVETGFEADEITMSIASDEVVRISCPECGTFHKLRVADLFAPGKSRQ